MYKRIILLGFIASFYACNKSSDQQINASAVNDTLKSTSTVEQEIESAPLQATSLNMQDLPFSTVAIGDFPFITLPEGLQPLNKPLEQKFGVCFFPINGVMTPFEGRLYKINVSSERGTTYSQHYFEKSMATYLESVGAVKIFEGAITNEEYKRYHTLDPNKGGEGDMGYAKEHLAFYVIRSKEQGNIYIQYNSNNAGGKLNILQEKPFEQTITKVTADAILNELSQNGKSILYIQFDSDQSQIKPQGKETVTQIAEALKKDKNLKISIEGHTDATGDAAHNKKLSQERAQTVMNLLVSDGIDKSRLSATGYGAEKPLLPNNSEDNKAKNRRVELVRIH